MVFLDVYDQPTYVDPEDLTDAIELFYELEGASDPDVDPLDEILGRLLGVPSWLTTTCIARQACISTPGGTPAKVSCTASLTR